MVAGLIERKGKLMNEAQEARIKEVNEAAAIAAGARADMTSALANFIHATYQQYLLRGCDGRSAMRLTRDDVAELLTRHLEDAPGQVVGEHYRAGGK